MKLRNLIIAIVVLVGLAGTLYWSNRHQPNGTTEASAPTSPKILSLKEDDITKVALKKKDAPDVVLTKDSAGKWQITAPQQLPAEQATVSPILSTLSSLTSDRLVEEKSSSLSEYGLAEPALEADVTEKNSQSHKLLLGDSTPTGNAIYAKLEGDPRIFTVFAYTKTGLDKSVNDLRDRRLLTVDPEKISKVELTAKKQTVEFGRSKDGWQIVKPQPARADSFKVDELVRTLTDARMDLSTTDDPKKLTASFAAATPLATAKVTDSAGTQELEVRKIKDDYYAKSSAVQGVYKVPNNVGTGLDKGFDDFRSKKLFDFGFNDPNKIEIHDGPKSYLFTRNGSDWWNTTGQKMDLNGMSSLLENVRNLSADQFLDKGFTASDLAVTVTSDDGKKTEKILLSKNGDNYIAKRENEPALYQLSSKAIDDLTKSAADLKPAVPPKK